MINKIINLAQYVIHSADIALRKMHKTSPHS